MGDDQAAVVPAGIDVPAISVANPQPAGGDEAAVVAGRDDLVAPADDLVADNESVGFDFAGGDPFRPGPGIRRPSTGVCQAGDSSPANQPGN